jgi:hypothetical protein
VVVASHADIFVTEDRKLRNFLAPASKRFPARLIDLETLARETA